MGPPYQGRRTPPEFQVGKTQSIFGTAEINLFFPEPPGWARPFGTLKPIQFLKFVVADLSEINSLPKMTAPLQELDFHGVVSKPF